MAVILDGGCRVSEMREGSPQVLGSLRIWKQIGRSTGATAVSLRILEFGPGLSPPLKNESSDEVFYFLESLEENNTEDVCTVQIDSQGFQMSQQSGLYLKPGQTLRIENGGSRPVVFVSAQCPDQDSPEQARQQLSSDPTVFPAVVRLADRRSTPTADRWYRVLIDEEVGSEQVTQFVGSIPPGRAPDHFHHYEEVLFILCGEGRMWSGETNTSIRAGSCIYLPKGQVHCVENTGTGELRLLGVFYPAGSPAVRYPS